MLKQKYFLTGIFILSAERQPIKLAWRKIVWLRKENMNNISLLLKELNVICEDYERRENLLNTFSSHRICIV